MAGVGVTMLQDPLARAGFDGVPHALVGIGHCERVRGVQLGGAGNPESSLIPLRKIAPSSNTRNPAVTIGPLGRRRDGFHFHSCFAGSPAVDASANLTRRSNLGPGGPASVNKGRQSFGPFLEFLFRPFAVRAIRRVFQTRPSVTIESFLEASRAKLHPDPRWPRQATFNSMG